MIGQLILRLTIWFLLTADFSLANIAIGFIIAFLLPRSYAPPEPLREWLGVSGNIFRAIPIAYLEAFELIFRPHRHEDVIMEKVPNHRAPLLIFLDVLLITFTPKTIVVKYHEEGFYEVHRVRRTSNT
ncbi:MULTISPECIES: Na+/H+ antiporter subunit E [unclassified Microcoleus]|uniref:Na+/H+ antiporter subunit E n=1 Tax=unclassified Microcoleus TaxID=2642155 RepID=UPI002FD0DA7B